MVLSFSCATVPIGTIFTGSVAYFSRVMSGWLRLLLTIGLDDHFVRPAQ